MVYSTNDVLFTCSYMPEEIIDAAGFIPVRIFPHARPSDADTAIHPTTCPYIRAVFAAADHGGLSGARGVVIVNSCDGMRRLYDALSAVKTAPPVVFLDVPQKRGPDAVDLFTAQLERFAGEVERAFGGAQMTLYALQRAIDKRNKIRRAMSRLFGLQRDDDAAIPGSVVFGLLMDAAAGGTHGVAERIDALESEAPKAPARKAGKRIVVSANVLDRPDLIEMIEGTGASVVALDTCTGQRHYDGLVNEGSLAPMRAVAERYLQRTPCPRMEGIAERIDYLVKLARSSQADGVVLSTVKYCDLWLYDEPLVKEHLEKAGIPVLAIENDYEWSGLAQTKTRVEAFLETLG